MVAKKKLSRSEIIIITLIIVESIGYLIYKFYPFTFTGEISFPGIKGAVELLFLYFLDGMILGSMMGLELLALYPSEKSGSKTAQSNILTDDLLPWKIALICTGPPFVLHITNIMEIHNFLSITY